MQQPPQARSGGRHAEVERLARRPQPPAAHVVGERRHRELLGDLGLADECPRAVAPHEIALTDEIVERCANGQPGHAEVGAQLPLGRDRVADRELLDEVEDQVSGRCLFRHGGHRNPRQRQVNTRSRRDRGGRLDLDGLVR